MPTRAAASSRVRGKVNDLGQAEDDWDPGAESGQRPDRL